MKPFKTKNIKVPENSFISGTEHLSTYCINIYCPEVLYENAKIEIYLYPTRQISFDDEHYSTIQIDNCDAYYVECWDEIEKKNFYIFSKDYKIRKNIEIKKENLNIDFVMKNLDDDIAFYSVNEQKLGVPYNGYIVKSNIDNSYLFLSTFWGQFSTLQYYLQTSRY